MKAFQFTLEAVRTVRQRQEQQALEVYIRALLARQQALQVQEDIDQLIAHDFERTRQLWARGCTAAQAAQAQNYHASLQKRRDLSLAALGETQQRVNDTFQAMLAARQQREMVDLYREKQAAFHQRREWREEQKTMDEFAMRRLTPPSSAQTNTYHD